VEVLQELLDFSWTWAVFFLLIFPEAQQHIDLFKGQKKNISTNTKGVLP